MRSLLFWGHLCAGVAAGVIILVMSCTGAVLALKPQILNWIERDVRFVEPAGTSRLPASALIDAARAGSTAGQHARIAGSRSGSVNGRRGQPRT